MASLAAAPLVDTKALQSFSNHFQSSSRIMALLGAGLSAAAGLPTFRGAGGLWRTHDAKELATPEAFERNPGLVWQFYSYRRHMALNARPNKAHVALAELAKRRRGFITLSQNVDGLSPRAGHPPSQLHLVHGSLFDVKCTGFYCDYLDRDNFTDPIVPALAIPRGSPDLTSNEARETAGYGEGAAIDHSRELDISNENVYLPELSRSDLPRCPKCKEGYLRPGVVWFGEALPADVLDEIDDWIDESEAIDLMLVIGTSAEVFPAAEYVDMAREKGARIAVVNTEPGDARKLRLTDRDWYFQGDASSIVPCILESVIGPVADVE